jgi:hypothetical protein
MSNVFKGNSIHSVNGQRGKVKLSLMETSRFNGENNCILEFLDQDDLLIDSVEFSIDNIKDLRDTLNQAASQAEQDFIPNTALSNYVKLSDKDLARLKREVEAYNERVLSDGGTIENQISVKDALPSGQNSGIIIRNVDIQNGIVKGIELDFLEIDDVQGLPAALANKEDDLGTPDTDGSFLVGDTDNKRYWRKVVEDKYHEYEQLTATNSWTINHGLNKKPAITLVDMDGNKVVGKVHFINDNQVTISFNNPFTGRAYFN